MYLFDPTFCTLFLLFTLCISKGSDSGYIYTKLKYPQNTPENMDDLPKDYDAVVLGTGTYSFTCYYTWNGVVCRWN